MFKILYNQKWIFDWTKQKLLWFLQRVLKQGSQTQSDSLAAYTWHILKSRGSHKKGKFELKLHVFL